MTIPFEDHCWKDIVDADTLEIYEAYQRNVYVGPRPAVLAIDLYKSAYRGGARPVVEVNRSFPGSCGANAWTALPPTQALFAAARRACVPIIYSTRHVDTSGVQSTNRKFGIQASDIYDIQTEVAPEPGDLVIY